MSHKKMFRTLNPAFNLVTTIERSIQVHIFENEEREMKVLLATKFEWESHKRIPFENTHIILNLPFHCADKKF